MTQCTLARFNDGKQIALVNNTHFITHKHSPLAIPLIVGEILLVHDNTDLATTKAPALPPDPHKAPDFDPFHHSIHCLI